MLLSPHGIDMLTLPILWSTQQGTCLILNLCDATEKGEMEPTYLAKDSPISYSIGSIPYYGTWVRYTHPLEADGWQWYFLHHCSAMPFNLLFLP